MDELVIIKNNGLSVTTSLKVAEIFGKDHRKVCRDIEELSCSIEFNAANFGRISYTDSMNREQRAYEMTKDGFSFLVMGYTGEKAAKFKEDFIKAFNHNEALLKNPDYILAQAQRILFERVKNAEALLRQKDERLALQEHELKQAAPKVEYYDSVLQAENTHTSTTIAKELGLNSAQALHKLLSTKGIMFYHEKHWVLFAKYQKLGLTTTRTHVREVIEKGVTVKKTDLITVWTEQGRMFLHSIFAKNEERA
jgi:Rha family phage regulatory protein